MKYASAKIRRETRSERIERERRQKKIELYFSIARNVGIIIAILFFIACIGYIGELDRQDELINAGYTAEKVSK